MRWGGLRVEAKDSEGLCGDDDDDEEHDQHVNTHRVIIYQGGETCF